MNRNDVWVDFITKDVRGKLKVPEDVVASRDCKKFTEWQFNKVPPPMHDLCPWYEFTPIYEVYVGDLKLRIPRKYMLLPNETDATTNILTTN